MRSPASMVDAPRKRSLASCAFRALRGLSLTTSDGVYVVKSEVLALDGEMVSDIDDVFDWGRFDS